MGAPHEAKKKKHVSCLCLFFFSRPIARITDGGDNHIPAVATCLLFRAAWSFKYFSTTKLALKKEKVNQSIKNEMLVSLQFLFTLCQSLSASHSQLGYQVQACLCEKVSQRMMRHLPSDVTNYVYVSFRTEHYK